MTVATAEPFFKGSTGRNSRGLLRLTILLTIAAAAVASRLFSVISMFMAFKLPQLCPGYGALQLYGKFRFLIKFLADE